MEPQLQCVEAVFSPQTGIVDSHQFMLALQGDAERDGATVRVPYAGRRDTMRATARFIVETGGDAPTRLQRSLRDQQRGPAGERRSRARSADSTRAMCRRSISRRATTSPSAAARRSSRLIYPMPNEAGLGVHLTIDLGGAGEVRSGRRMGRSRSTTTSIRSARMRSTRRFARTGRVCPTARCSRPMREFARSSPARANPPPTS